MGKCLVVPQSFDISFLLKDFKAAADNVRKLEKTPPNEVFASLYSLYKQATVGDCDKGKQWFGLGDYACKFINRVWPVAIILCLQY